MCCYCGDFNARMGCLNDFVHDTPWMGMDGVNEEGGHW